VKLLHTFFHLLAMPCVALGFLAVLESHNRATPEPIPNFYSLHSWMGFVTMGLFGLQVRKCFFILPFTHNLDLFFYLSRISISIDFFPVKAVF